MFFLHLYSYPIILIITTLEKGVYYIKESQPFVAGSLLFSYCSGFNQEPVPLILLLRFFSIDYCIVLFVYNLSAVYNRDALVVVVDTLSAKIIDYTFISC